MMPRSPRTLRRKSSECGLEARAPVALNVPYRVPTPEHHIVAADAHRHACDPPMHASRCACIRWGCATPRLACICCRDRQEKNPPLAPLRARTHSHTHSYTSPPLLSSKFFIYDAEQWDGGRRMEDGGEGHPNPLLPLPTSLPHVTPRAAPPPPALSPSFSLSAPPFLPFRSHPFLKVLPGVTLKLIFLIINDFHISPRRSLKCTRRVGDRGARGARLSERRWRRR